MKRIIYSLVASVVFLGSCNNRLDIAPEQSIPTEVGLSTSENIESLLIGSYERAGTANLYGGFVQLLADLYGFTDQAIWRGTFQQPREAYNKRITVDNSFVTNHWLNAYRTINAANLIIDHLEVVDEDIRDRVEGEAKFLRALLYFDLVRSFAKPYEAGQQNTQLAVPLSLTGILDYDRDLTIGRNTAEEVYSQVLTDLNDAYDLLPESNGYYADRYSAKALLARVYLQQGNYTEARDAANDVITNSGRGLARTFAEAFNSDANTDEDLFAFQVTNQDGTNELVVHYASQALGGRGGDVDVLAGYLAKFDDGDDERAGFFYASGSRRLSSKYTNQFGNVSLIRLAEIYLIRAESNFRLDSEEGATPEADVNEVRARAGAGPLATVTLEDILLERERELAFEGFLIHDLKRTGQSIVITETIGGEPTEVSIPYDADRLVYPIPLREMDANNKLVQNPGYGS